MGGWAGLSEEPPGSKGWAARWQSLATQRTLASTPSAQALRGTQRPFCQRTEEAHSEEENQVTARHRGHTFWQDPTERAGGRLCVGSWSRGAGAELGVGKGMSPGSEGQCLNSHLGKHSLALP